MLTFFANRFFLSAIKMLIYFKNQFPMWISMNMNEEKKNKCFDGENIASLNARILLKSFKNMLLSNYDRPLSKKICKIEIRNYRLYTDIGFLLSFLLFIMSYYYRGNYILCWYYILWRILKFSNHVFLFNKNKIDDINSRIVNFLQVII